MENNIFFPLYNILLFSCILHNPIMFVVENIEMKCFFPCKYKKLIFFSPPINFPLIDFHSCQILLIISWKWIRVTLSKNKSYRLSLPITDFSFPYSTNLTKIINENNVDKFKRKYESINKLNVCTLPPTRRKHCR